LSYQEISLTVVPVTIVRLASKSDDRGSPMMSCDTIGSSV
jgi:hypothetical protein